MLRSAFLGILFVGLFQCVFSANPHAYLGGEIGYTKMHYGSGDFDSGEGTVTNTPGIEKNGIGFRGLVGMRWVRPYEDYAVEIAYRRFGTLKASNLTLSSSQTTTATIKQHDIEILLAYIIKTDYKIDLALKAGGAWVKADGSLNNMKATGSALRIIYGLGLNYALTKHISSGISWMRIGSGGSIKRSDFYGVSAIYQF